MNCARESSESDILDLFEQFRQTHRKIALTGGAGSVGHMAQPPINRVDNTPPGATKARIEADYPHLPVLLPCDEFTFFLLLGRTMNKFNELRKGVV